MKLTRLSALAVKSLFSLDLQTQLVLTILDIHLSLFLSSFDNFFGQHPTCFALLDVAAIKQRAIQMKNNESIYQGKNV